MGIQEIKATIHSWPKILEYGQSPHCYSVTMQLPHKAFNVDSNNYNTIKQAKRSAQSLAARMGWKLTWEVSQ